MRLAEVGSGSLQYEHTIKKGELVIGTGHIKTAALQFPHGRRTFRFSVELLTDHLLHPDPNASRMVARSGM